MYSNKKKQILNIKKKKKILGRGISAGQGKTCGRGMKGQRARSGGRVRIGFEGGQTELCRRLPKHGQRGISSPKIKEKKIKSVNVGSVQNNIKIIDGSVLDLSGKNIKILGRGEITKKITIKASKFSDSAKKKTRTGRRKMNYSIKIKFYKLNK